MNPIKLKTPRKVVSQPEISTDVTEFVVNRMIDLPMEKQVLAFVFAFQPDPIVVFSGDEYDAIGQWTDQDLINKVIQILNLDIDTTTQAPSGGEDPSGVEDPVPPVDNSDPQP